MPAHIHTKNGAEADDVFRFIAKVPLNPRTFLM
jgi:hypothetical protein